MAAQELDAQDAGVAPDSEPPKLSMADYQTYNHMSVHMDSFHNHFRQEWRTLWDSCSATSTTKAPSAAVLIRVGLAFISHLTMHHDIEETYIFPYLAKRMPEFRPNAPHLEQHKQIHKGMDELEEYLKQCRQGSRDFRREEVRECMQKWGEVLWLHLDEEVNTLSAPNMRKYWTLDEMKHMPM